MTKAIANDTAALALDQKMIAGVNKYFASLTKVTIAGTDFTPATLLAVFQNDSNAQTALDAGRATVKQLTATQRAARKTMRATRKALRTYLLGNYGEAAASMLNDFGLAPTKQTVKTVAVKAEAIEKSKATRAAGGTKGKADSQPPAAPASTTPTK